MPFVPGHTQPSPPFTQHFPWVVRMVGASARTSVSRSSPNSAWQWSFLHVSAGVLEEPSFLPFVCPTVSSWIPVLNGGYKRLVGQ